MLFTDTVEFACGLAGAAAGFLIPAWLLVSDLPDRWFWATRSRSSDG